MTPALDDLLNDNRLSRLFSNDAKHCVLQLWILQIKSGEDADNRVIYGRLLPYHYSNNSWSSSDNDKYQKFEQVQARVIRLNLFIKSTDCAELLRQLSLGESITQVSDNLQLKIDAKLKSQVGGTALSTHNLVYRPVAYLLNRDAHDQRALSSPHGGAGAFSASITQADKTELFNLGHGCDIPLISSVIEQLNSHTGLDFGGKDIARFGDLELLVFPALDDEERCLLSVNWTEAPRTLVARFNSTQVSYFRAFQFRLSIENDGHIVHSTIAKATPDKEGVFEYRFELTEQLRARTDSTDIEVFGLADDNSNEGILCCRWQVGYIREISLQGHVLGDSTSSVKFDWLERTTRVSASNRVQAALTVNRGNRGFTNSIGSREADPWVPANRELASLFIKLRPPKSEGQFFLRWGVDGKDRGEGRLQFVEWFKKLLAKYQQHQIVIFDPYFDTAGLGLLLLSATPNANYFVFTSLPEHKDEAISVGSDKPVEGRVSNLVTNCENYYQQNQHIKLRIYGLKYGRLHDRYILITDSDGLPAAGFNLSNSLQQAAENHPLLVTPIPADVLFKVERYKSELVQEAKIAQSKSRGGNPLIQQLFDSDELSSIPKCYERLFFLEKSQSGNVLSRWTNEPSLQGLSGSSLKEQMTQLGLLKDSSLVLPQTPGFSHCLPRRLDKVEDFTAAWEVLGEILAHSPSIETHFHGVESETIFLNFLESFLKKSFERSYEGAEKELAVMDRSLFNASIETFLYSSYRMEHFCHRTKYTALTWSEYYAIKLLWWYTPDRLLTIVEFQIAAISTGAQDTDTMRLSLLSQIIGQISMSMHFNPTEEQRSLLISSQNALLHWLGLNSIEQLIEEPENFDVVVNLLNDLSEQQKLLTLGWMINRAEREAEQDTIYKALISTLHDALPAKIGADELKKMVDSMCGHMKQLTWTEPWLFKDVVQPLLQDGRVSTDDAFEIWAKELADLMDPTVRSQSRLFERKREGDITRISALLFSDSSSGQQQSIVKSIDRILASQRRTLQQPLASTVNWAGWDDALVVSMWILAFTRWCQYYLSKGGKSNPELDKLSSDAYTLVMLRPMSEWQSYEVGSRKALMDFFKQADDLVAYKMKDDSI